MAKLDQAGFTLIEITLVLAITGALLAIVWNGQSQLRNQAQFDAAMDKIVASINETRTEATTAVNNVGSGTGQNATSCPSTLGSTVFAGTSWTVDSSASPTAFSINSYKATPLTNACSFQTQGITVSYPVHVSTGSPARSSAQVLFVRTSSGGLAVCELVPSAPATAVASFKDGQCDNPATEITSASPLQLEFTDGSGRSSEVTINDSGLAQRIN